MLHQALCIISKPSVNSNWSYSPETLNSGQNRQFFVPCDLEFSRMTLKNKRAPFLCCFKLCASFHSHQWIQTRVTVQKRPIWVKIDVFLSSETLKFDRWPWKALGHLFYTTSSLVHHFKAISEFKLELQSGNTQFGSKSAIFCPVWPWNWTDDLEKNRAPLLCCFKLCASFHSHQWLQAGVTVRKGPICVKIDDFLSCVTLKFYRWPWKRIGQLFYAISSFVHHFLAIGESKPELQSGNAKFGSKLTFFSSCVTLKFDRWPWKTIGYLF